MDVAAWQKRLEDDFTAYGVVGGHLLEVIEMERAYGEYIANTFHGQSVLMDSFQSFFIETLRSTQGWLSTEGWPEDCPYYSSIFVYYLTVFRSFRACQNLFVAGYPLDGYALFRDLKDRAVFLCGIASNLTTLEAITAQDRGTRMKEERRVLSLIAGCDSGLTAVELDHLAQWENLFHQEVHGSKLTFFTELGALVCGERSMSIAPVPDERSIGMYMNRAVEVAWLFIRLFPYLQPEAGAFGDEWSRRRLVLDESFRDSEQALADLDKKIGDVFIKLVDLKFSFPAALHYVEADGRAT